MFGRSHILHFLYIYIRRLLGYMCNIDIGLEGILLAIYTYTNSEHPT